MPSNNISIVFLLDALPWNFGPYQQQGHLLAQGLIDAGHDVSWFATRGWTAPEDPEEEVAFATPTEAAAHLGVPQRVWQSASPTGLVRCGCRHPVRTPG